MAHKVRVCPRCGSTKLHEVKTSVSGWLVPSLYQCPDCHYSGPIYVEVDAEDVGRIQAVMADKSKE